MERLTEKHWKNLDPWETCGQDHFCGRGCHDLGGCSNGCIVPKLYARLAAYEDAMPLERAQELAQAEKDDRLVVLPCKPGDDLIRNDLVFKGDHWNVLLTAFADDASAPLGKRVKLFSPEEAEAALKRMEDAQHEN